METELCCCLGAFLWALGATFAWAICRVGGMADERMESAWGHPDGNWLDGEKVRLVSYDVNGKPVFEYNKKYYDKWADEAQ